MNQVVRCDWLPTNEELEEMDRCLHQNLKTAENKEN